MWPQVWVCINIIEPYCLWYVFWLWLFELFIFIFFPNHHPKCLQYFFDHMVYWFSKPQVPTDSADGPLDVVSHLCARLASVHFPCSQLHLAIKFAFYIIFTHLSSFLVLFVIACFPCFLMLILFLVMYIVLEL